MFNGCCWGVFTVFRGIWSKMIILDVAKFQKKNQICYTSNVRYLLSGLCYQLAYLVKLLWWPYPAAAFTCTGWITMNSTLVAVCQLLVISPDNPLVQTQNWNNTWLFENFSYGLRYGGVSVGLSGQNQKNRSVWIFKLEGRNLLPKKLCSAIARLKI